MQPTISLENNTYIFTLWRDGKKVVHEFENYYVLVCMGNELSLSPADRAKIGEPAFDGYYYYIYVQPRDGEEIFIWLSEEEFQILEPMHYELQKPEEEPEDDPHDAQEVMRYIMHNFGGK